MKKFTYNVEIADAEAPVTEALQDIFSSTARNLQKITKEHKKLRDMVAALTKERDGFKAEAAKLRNENMALKEALRNGGAANGGSMQSGPYEFWKEIKSHGAPVHSVAVSKKNLMATASWDATISINELDPENPQRFKKTLGPKFGMNGVDQMGGLYAVAFGKTQAASHVLGCTSCDSNVYIWNYQTGELLKKLTGHSNEVNHIDFHTSQQVICTASDDKSVLIWDFKEGITLRTLSSHEQQVYGAKFLGEENQYLVATVSFDRKIRIFDMRDKRVVKTIDAHTDDIIGIDYNAEVQAIATGSDDGIVKTWDCRQSFKLSSEINVKGELYPENEVKRVTFCPDGSQLAAACSSGNVMVYDYNTKEQVALLEGHTDCVFEVGWGTLPNGRKVICSASHDHTSRIWVERG